MVAIQNKLKSGNFGARMILQVHDELNFDVPRKELEAVRALVKEAMEQACSLKVPLVVDMGEGSSWLEAH
jgi:DNA polymerase-1